ncbi:Na(+)/H(+) exchange regulatory cofactor NHE-RF2 [Brachionichthys hirsutus]|uniref:Na(+)/H(+) exchange regulatory cofactor NHE-RF2 n=1 Tax=Brachionichthys hirsutus TaxID=412623 RepID=UPI003604BF3E
MEGELRPRLCYLTRGEHGYGFHLQGHLIRSVEPGSAAHLAGLRPGDRLVEVNGEKVGNQTHRQVVTRVCEYPHRTRLLVTDRDTDSALRGRGLACTEDLAVERGTLSPRPLPRGGSPLSPKLQRVLLRAADPPPQASPPVTSRSATDTEVRVQAPPCLEAPGELLPRRCHLVRGQHGYGFNLHSGKMKGGQFVRSVAPGSAAEGGDRLVEVGRVNGLRHSEVVALIRAGGGQEADEHFQRLGLSPPASHVKEVFMDGSTTESDPSTPSLTSDLPVTDPPIKNVTRTDPSLTEMSPESWANGSSASQSSRSSTTQSEISSSDVSIQVHDEDDGRVSDSFIDGGLRLSPTAAEARQMAAGRIKRRAPPMDWAKKYQLFSNF